ncbi:hypothetical protein [Nitrosomonas sp. Nm34]|uniref:hypothetical protein n=1 Tax=Nitrosomonas sp. Nm34 TaxID=1881055 RepID=UPI0008E71D81|nr:hypothetical protein [Nitrosomonas sp. Nm34]SFJ12716.1 hypothetical protein SAMN05428978_11204 [Nitrosomonas sp. Nm34]
MARKASKIDQLVSTRELLKNAKTAEELRSSQAVWLPLELSMSIEQTVKVIGRSVRWTCTQRRRYCRIARCEEEAPRTKTESA